MNRQGADSAAREQTQGRIEDVLRKATSGRKVTQATMQTGTDRDSYRAGIERRRELADKVAAAAAKRNLTLPPELSGHETALAPHLAAAATAAIDLFPQGFRWKAFRAQLAAENGVDVANNIAQLRGLDKKLVAEVVKHRGTKTGRRPTREAIHQIICAACDIIDHSARQQRIAQLELARAVRTGRAKPGRPILIGGKFPLGGSVSFPIPDSVDLRTSTFGDAHVHAAADLLTQKEPVDARLLYGIVAGAIAPGRLPTVDKEKFADVCEALTELPEDAPVGAYQTNAAARRLIAATALLLSGIDLGSSNLSRSLRLSTDERSAVVDVVVAPLAAAATGMSMA